jgi:hypothetical protein
VAFAPLPGVGVAAGVGVAVAPGVAVGAGVGVPEGEPEVTSPIPSPQAAMVITARANAAPKAVLVTIGMPLL